MSPAEFFAGHTYRMVFAGTTVIGLVSGALGAFAYLRRQSLIADVVSHAALPGTLIAFLTAVVVFDADGRTMGGLVAGAIVVGTMAVLAANHVARTSKIRIDTAMAVVLVTFFGAGMLLLRIVADGTYPGKGGIADYLFGNASVLTRADLVTAVVVGGSAVLLVIAVWGPLTLRTFDPDHATVLGFPPRIVDPLLFVTIAVATVIGVKAVGLVLMVAFVVTPPAAARQWVRSLPAMVVLSGIVGAAASGIGAYLSIALGSVPTGPVVVLTLFAILVVSLVFSPRRSVLVRAVARARARRALVRDLSGPRSAASGSAASGSAASDRGAVAP